MKNCNKCGTVMTGNDNYCLYCKTLLTDCAINAKGYKQLSAPVPWCHHRDERIIYSKAGCSSCEHYVDKHMPKEVD